MTNERDWRELAECRFLDPRVFFGGDDEVPGQRVLRERAAVSVCGSCVVRRPCGEFAISNAIGEGVWGGMTESYRERVTRAGNAR